MSVIISKLLLYIAVIERIAAFHAEFRRIMRIFRFPAALIALIERRTCRLRLTALHAEFALVYSTALAAPAVLGRLWRAALRAELA